MRRNPLPSTTQKKLSPDQVELRKIRLANHLPQAEMAIRIGCKLPTYQAYEYGKTSSVNPKVMEMARKLKVNPDYSYVAKLYKRKSMAQVAAAWSKRLKIPVGNVSELARVIGVDKATVHRWYQPDSEIMPEMEMLAIYERRVNAEEKYIVERNAAAAEATRARSRRRVLN